MGKLARMRVSSQPRRRYGSSVHTGTCVRTRQTSLPCTPNVLSTPARRGAFRICPPDGSPCSALGQAARPVDAAARFDDRRGALLSRRQVEGQALTLEQIWKRVLY